MLCGAAGLAYIASQHHDAEPNDQRCGRGELLSPALRTMPHSAGGAPRPYVDAWQTAVLRAPVTHSWKQHLAQPATCLARVYSPPPRTHQQITPDCNHFFTLF